MRGRRSPEHRAREVVGLYGDPETTWGIAVEARVASSLTAADVRRRSAELVTAFPHLGAPPDVDLVDVEDWDDRRTALAAAPYRPGAPHLRIALADTGAGARLLVAAHHGVCDGLGLLAVVQACAGVPLHPAARGIGDLRGRGTFLGVSAARFVEALRNPPPRFRVPSPGEVPGETLLVRALPRSSVGTIDVSLALARVHAERHGRPARRSRRPLLVVGASRRAPGSLAPDRQTAYFRFRTDPAWDRVAARESFQQLLPEPDFPETSAGGLGPLVTRLLRGRLGSTALVSNLGAVDGAVTSLAMFPALSGPRAVALGLASTPESTTVTLRTRRAEFAPEDAASLLDDVVSRLTTA